MARPLNRPARLMLTALVTALAVVACNPGTASPSASPSASSIPSSAPPAFPSPASPSAAAGALEPSDVDAALADAANLDGKRIALRGFLLIEPTGARLCSLVLESYPPQCGGGAIAVRGGIPPVILAQLDSTTEEPGLNPATWGDVALTGTFHAGDGRPAIDIDGISIVTPE
jgi:hypothetical protein